MPKTYDNINSLIVELVLPFNQSPNIVREVKKLSPSSK